MTRTWVVDGEHEGVSGAGVTLRDEDWNRVSVDGRADAEALAVALVNATKPDAYPPRSLIVYSDSIGYWVRVDFHHESDRDLSADHAEALGIALIRSAATARRADERRRREMSR